MANPKNLPADLLAYMQSLQAPTQYGQNGAQYTRDGFMPVYNTSWAASPETGQGPSGDGSLMSIVGQGRNPEENAEFDPQTGEFKRYYTVKDKFMGMDPMLAFALATGGMMMLPGGLLSGALGAGAGAEAGGGLLSGAEGSASLAGSAAGDTLAAEGLFSGAGTGFAGADIGSGMFLDGTGMIGMGSSSALPAGLSVAEAPGFLGGLTGATGGAALGAQGMNFVPGAAGGSSGGGGAGSGSGGSSAFNAAKDSQLANEAIGAGAIDGYRAGAGGLSTLTDFLGKYAPNLIGAALGAAGSKDQTQTSSREPWGPAQPWLKDNIAKGQELQKFYENNPFNDVQKGALQGLLDVSNTGAQALPGLLDFANRMGQSNYQRSGGRNLAYSAPGTAAPRGVMPTGLAAAPAVDWASMNPFARKA